MKEQVQMIQITQLHPFRNHPFQVKEDEAMDALCDSIREHGVIKENELGTMDYYYFPPKLEQRILITSDAQYECKLKKLIEK